jgi:hypothetical protein
MWDSRFKLNKIEPVAVETAKLYSYINKTFLGPHLKSLFMSMKTFSGTVYSTC